MSEKNMNGLGNKNFFKKTHILLKDVYVFQVYPILFTAKIFWSIKLNLEGIFFPVTSQETPIKWH